MDTITNSSVALVLKTACQQACRTAHRYGFRPDRFTGAMVILLFTLAPWNGELRAEEAPSSIVEKSGSQLFF